MERNNNRNADRSSVSFFVDLIYERIRNKNPEIKLDSIQSEIEVFIQLVPIEMVKPKKEKFQFIREKSKKLHLDQKTIKEIGEEILKEYAKEEQEKGYSFQQGSNDMLEKINKEKSRVLKALAEQRNGEEKSEKKHMIQCIIKKICKSNEFTDEQKIFALSLILDPYDSKYSFWEYMFYILTVMLLLIILMYSLDYIHYYKIFNNYIGLITSSFIFCFALFWILISGLGWINKNALFDFDIRPVFLFIGIVAAWCMVLPVIIAVMGHMCQSLLGLRYYLFFHYLDYFPSRYKSYIQKKLSKNRNTKFRK